MSLPSRGVNHRVIESAEGMEIATSGLVDVEATGGLEVAPVVGPEDVSWPVVFWGGWRKAAGVSLMASS